MTITTLPLPTADRLIVRRDAKSERSVHGIILPSTGPDLNSGLVLAAGPGRTTQTGTLVPMNVQAGDRILFNAYAATNPFKMINAQGQEEELMILPEGEVIAILEDGVQDGVQDGAQDENADQGELQL